MRLVSLDVVFSVLGSGFGLMAGILLDSGSTARAIGKSLDLQPDLLKEQELCSPWVSA